MHVDIAVWWMLYLMYSMWNGAICVIFWAQMFCMDTTHTHNYYYTRLTALFPGLPGWAGTRKVKPIWILLKQETVSGSGISWTICKSAPRFRQITTPLPHHSVFYRPDSLPATQPTASKHCVSKYTRDIFDVLSLPSTAVDVIRDIVIFLEVREKIVETVTCCIV